MKTRSLIALIAMTIIVLIAAVWIHLAPSDQAANAAAERSTMPSGSSERKAVPATAPVTTIAPATTVATPNPATRGGESHPIWVEFENARNLRVLFESLMRRREPGAGLYALNILIACGRVLDAPPATGPADSREQELARQMLGERCSSFTKDELSSQQLAQSLKDPRFKDRHIDLWNEWGRAASDPSKRLALQQEILATNNPLLLERIGPWMYYRIPSDGLSIEGKLYSQEQATATIATAWTAAVCEGTNTACGTTDMAVLQNCAVFNLCEPSRKETLAHSIEEQFGADGLALYRSTYQKLVDAIQTKRTAPLM